MDLELLTQADFTLNACGRPVAPTGLSAVYIPRLVMVQYTFPAGATSPTQQITKEITGDTTWCLRTIAIASSSATAISVQFLLPNGRFLVNNIQDALQIAGYGSFRYLFTKQLRCPPGTKIQVTFQCTNTTDIQPISVEFGGAYKYYLKSEFGSQRICPTDEAASELPRIWAVEQNIMAPCWQHGIGTYTPPGYSDEQFVYAAANPTLIGVTATNLTATQQIQIDSDSEFHVRRLLFQIIPDESVTGNPLFLGRVRNGSGYALCDDYFDLAGYLGSAPWPHDWIIDPGDSIYADLQLVDPAGTGNMSFQMWADGFKRRKAA